MFNLVLQDRSVASFVELVGQKKYNVFLICSQGKTPLFSRKTPSFSRKCQEKLGKSVMHYVYESRVTVNNQVLVQEMFSSRVVNFTDT